MNQELLEKHLCNQSNHYKNTVTKGNYHVLPPDQHKLNKWNTQEETSKSMKNALYIQLYCGMPTGTSWAKVKNQAIYSLSC